MMRAAARVAVTTLAVVACVAPVAAFAAWSSSGATHGTVRASSVSQANQPTVKKSGSGVAINWARSTLDDGRAVIGYQVLRHAGSTTTVVCTTTDPTTTCIDSKPAKYVSYGVVARFGGWTGPESDLTGYGKDKTKPQTSVATSPDPNKNGWYDSDVQVRLTATDTGSGVASIDYSVNGGQTVTVSGSTANINVSTEGKVTLKYRATDVAGNKEKYLTDTLSVDTTAPTSTISPAPSTWGQSVTVAGVDATSGVAQIAYKVDGAAAYTFVDGASATFTPVDGTHTITYYAVDEAGNAQSPQTSMVSVDDSAPTIGIGSPIGGAVFGDAVAWGSSCTTYGGGGVCGTATDPASGVASETMTLQRQDRPWCWTGATSGTAWSAKACKSSLPVTGEGAGAWFAAVPFSVIDGYAVTLTLTATDTAGNTASASVSFAGG